MSAPRATRAQLLPVIQRALASTTGNGAELVLVRADPDSADQIGPIDDTGLTVIGSSSPLQIRAALRDHDHGPLVVLTDLDTHTLGADLLARAARRRVHRLDRWATVSELFGASQPSRELSQHPELADALIEAQPPDGYPQVTSRVLDLQTAITALVRSQLGIADDIDGLAGFIDWVAQPVHAGKLARAHGPLLDHLRPALIDRFGPGINLVITAVLDGHSEQLVPLGLVTGLVHAAGPDGTGPSIRIQERYKLKNGDPEAHIAWGEAAEQLLESPNGAPHATRWLEQAETLLAKLDATGLAHRSRLLRTGFDQRIAAAADTLTRWHDNPANTSLAHTADAAISHVEAHRASQRAPERAHRLRMAARLIRRRGFDIADARDLVGHATSYQRDGAWLDAARLVVSRGDTDPTLDALCTRLTTAANTSREGQGAALAQILTAAAHPLPDGLTGLENTLHDVVAPLAHAQPVLVLVLDGLGLSTFCDLIDQIENSGWAQFRRAGAADPPVGVAALPTVTETSRTALLTGQLRQGTAGDERRGFEQHPALQHVSQSNAAPLLFHKRDLRAGGLDTKAEEVLAAIADPRQRAVGLVINTIDERLKDVAQPVAGWRLEDLDPLRSVLDGARHANRIVVLTGDHGHILDRNAEARPGRGGGERWHPGDTAGDGEVRVTGPRVVTGDNSAVLPWREQLHYGTRRNGYHGGLTPQEVFVPIAVLSTGDQIDGWEATTAHRPAWWNPAPPASGVAGAAPPAPTTRPAVRRTAPADTPSLFDATDTTTPDQPAATPAGPAGGWVGQVLATKQITDRRRSPRIRLTDDELRRMLDVLAAAGTTPVAQARLAQQAELPPARIRGYIAQLQDLLNVDGYAVVTTRDGEIRFDAALLTRQLGL